MNQQVVVSRKEGERPVRLRLEEGGGKTFLSTTSQLGTADAQREVAFLNELHLELFMAAAQHTVGLRRGLEGHQQVDMISMASGPAKHWFSFAYNALMVGAASILH